MKSNQEKIIEVAKKQKLIHLRDLNQIPGARVEIARLVEKGKLEKIGRGLYCIAGTNFDEKQSILEVTKLVPKGVICLLSALRYHELTTQNPFEVWIAIQRPATTPKIDFISVNIIRFSGRAFSEGIETHTFDGNTIRVYSPAKTIADCFKFRNKIGLDVALEALRDARRKKKASIDDLWHFARICRVSRVMRPYLESIV